MTGLAPVALAVAVAWGLGAARGGARGGADGGPRVGPAGRLRGGPHAAGLLGAPRPGASGAPRPGGSGGSVARLVTRTLGRNGRRSTAHEGCEPARWATRRDARTLVVPAPVPGRLSLGVARGRLLAAEAGHSVLVVGPTQSRKTSGFAVPAILEWEGPVVAASVKSDLARHTVEWRRRCGQVWVYDPSAVTGMPRARWSPLDIAETWEGARRTAVSLTDVARVSTGSLTDGDFWYATAAKLLAPLLHAASVSGRTMVDVVRWLDTQEIDEIADILEGAGERRALQAVQASWGRDDRQRSAVYTTAETAVEVFADPEVAASTDPAAVPGTGATGTVDPVRLLDGRDTLYLCAPAHDQRRLRPVFATLVTQVIEAAYQRASRLGGPLDPPLLVVLDEAANVAPLAELDVLASTAAGHGVQLVTVWQDLAQIHARYGTRAGTVVNNHRVKVFLSGIADPGTLEHASALIGDTEVRSWATTVDATGATSVTDSAVPRRLAPADALRRIRPGEAVVVSGHLPPIRLSLRPWQDDKALRARAEATASQGEVDASSAP